MTETHLKFEERGIDASFARKAQGFRESDRGTVEIMDIPIIKTAWGIFFE